MEKALREQFPFSFIRLRRARDTERRETFAGTVIGVLVLVYLIFTALSVRTVEAQVSTVGASTSSQSTTSAARKTFYDVSFGYHWVFWFSGSGLEYASSGDGLSWTSRGTISLATANFSVVSQVINGSSYVFLVSEENSYDITIRRGTISGASITFDSPVTVFDGSSASDNYTLPHVAIDSDSKLWVGAVKDGDASIGQRYRVVVARTTGDGSTTLSFGSSMNVGQSLATLSGISMTSTDSGTMFLAVSGESGSNLLGYRYDGVSWVEVTSGGAVGWGAFARNGVNGTIDALVSDGNGKIYVGGNFTTAGGLTVNYIAKWDGVSWSSLGSGMSGEVRALALDSSGNLYAGGDFSTAGGVTVNRIAKWDGSKWSALGTGASASIHAVDVDGDGNVYAGGAFTTIGGISASYVAKWNGSTWSALSSGVDNTVRSLAHDSSGTIYAGGLFQNASGLSVKYIASWNGSSWSAVGGGMNGAVYALHFDHYGTLHAGGAFTTAGSTTVGYIAKWDGTSWVALSNGVDSSTVYAITHDSQGNLYIGGDFTAIGGVSVNRVAKWNGSTWSALGTGATTASSFVYALATDSNDNLLVGGSFTSVGGVSVNRIGSWNGSSWRTVGDGLEGSTNAVVGDANGNVYIGGISRAGGASTSNIVKWDGGSFSALGSGVNGTVRALAHHNGTLYVGGQFTTAGGGSASKIAKWNGSSWSNISSASINGTSVYAVAVDSNGNLFIGGDFTTVGGITVNYIAKWDGSSWQALGSGMNGQVNALAVDGNNNLYVGGAFTKANGSTVNYVAKWDGTSWNALGSGAGASVNAIAVDGNGTVYVGGTFTAAGGSTANRIAKWDGSSWSALGTGANQTVSTLAVDGNNNLYAGGSFLTMNSITVNYIAKWSGSSWSALGAGIGGTVAAIGLDSNGVLYAGSSNNLRVQRTVAAANQLSGTQAALVRGSSGVAHLHYIDTSYDVIRRTASGAPMTWAASSIVHAGTVSSVATSYNSALSKLTVWFIDSGSLEFRQSNSPFSSWSSASFVSSTGSPQSIECYGEANLQGETLAVWNRTGASAGEVASYVADLMPTNTPTSTPTQTPTSTATPTSTPLDTPTSTPTDVGTVTPTSTPADTPTVTPTATPTETTTITPTSSQTASPTVTPTLVATDTPTVTPTETPTASPTNSPTITPTSTITDTPTITPTGTDTPTVTPTLTPTPVTGDVDSDLIPDTALLAPKGGADVIVGVSDISGTAMKIPFKGGFVAVDIGRAPGQAVSTLITAARVLSNISWNSIDVMSGVSITFASVPAVGAPVTGCYFQDTYVPAMFIKKGSQGSLRMFTSPAETAISLPAGTEAVRCGNPVSGTSALFSLVNNKKRRSKSVTGIVGNQVILSTKPIDSKLSNLSLGIVPRALNEQPTVMILGRRGTVRLIQILSRGNVWKALKIKEIPKGFNITGISAVRLSGGTYIVVQLTGKRSVTSYQVVAVPSSWL